MRAKLKVKCFACDCKTEVYCKRPGFLETVSVPFTCSGCEAKLMAQISRKKTDWKKKRPVGKKADIPIDVQIKVLTPSEKFLEIMREQEAERASLNKIIEDNTSGHTLEV